MVERKINKNVNDEDFSDLLELSKSVMKKLWDNKEDGIWDSA